jgi:hypothetical protein
LNKAARLSGAIELGNENALKKPRVFKSDLHSPADELTRAFLFVLFSLLKKFRSAVVDPFLGSVERVSFGFCFGVEPLCELKTLHDQLMFVVDPNLRSEAERVERWPTGD